MMTMGSLTRAHLGTCTPLASSSAPEPHSSISHAAATAHRASSVLPARSLGARTPQRAFFLSSSAGSRRSQSPGPCSCQAAVAECESTSASTNGASSNGTGKKPLRVIIAGAGIGGLVCAVGLLKQGFDVQLLERDISAIRGEGKYRGPIQVRMHVL